MSQQHDCPFCDIAHNTTHQRMIAQNNYAFTICDGYPVTEGHSLFIPKRHIVSFFKTSEGEREYLMALLELAKGQLNGEFQPANFNIVINDGPPARQTVPHMRIHLIPPYEEEGKDPRDGVRRVVAEKVDYRSNQS